MPDVHIWAEVTLGYASQTGHAHVAVWQRPYDISWHSRSISSQHNLSAYGAQALAILQHYNIIAATIDQSADRY